MGWSKTSGHANSATNNKPNNLCNNKTLELLGIHYIIMDFIFSILLLIVKVLNVVTHPLFVYFSKGKKKTVPPIRNDLLKISATDLAAKIRKKELPSEEICKAYIERIKEVNPVINAIVEERFQQALKEAKNVDDYLTKCSLSEEDLVKIKPLLGVPITVKESCSLQGMSLTGGLINRTGYKAESDGEAVARLKTSGAIPLLVSNTPELCGWVETTNFITGRTNNPYDTTCTSGGSSGGEGALLGAGASVIGLGSDIAGSIRVPAMFNGIFGHKPTARLVSIKGHFPYCYDEKFKDALLVGPMTRYAKDLRLMMKILVGDKQTAHLKLNQEVDISKLKVFSMDNSKSILEPPVQDEIKSAIRDAVKYLSKQCGAKIMDHKFKELQYALTVCAKDENQNLFVETLKSIFGQSDYSWFVMQFLILNKVFDTFVSDHSREVAIMKKELLEHLGDNGILIYPTMLSSAVKHYETFFVSSGISYLIIANSLGLPATNVPCGLDKNGLPIGIQIIAAPNQDRLCLAVAEELEKCFGGWIPPQ
ncbi:hypothetical protein NQ317_000970 [Molorchus minor]|uniref:Amidase domain-containing protein n=1 Tax=Molorchus minor TaxID=1323400 RepID=A0ABQ9IWQ8_9CUCU|nr:hypothetical protein NQ317_000970 [Molorchus minor]